MRAGWWIKAESESGAPLRPATFPRPSPPSLSMILIITVLAAIYFSVCPSDRDYLNRVMEEIKNKNKKMLSACRHAPLRGRARLTRA